MTRRFTLQGRRKDSGTDFEATLNPEQYAVATAPTGPMLVIAGAGSGKTRALTYRLVWLVEHEVDPSRIMLVTFSNRAAREMLQRVTSLLHTDTNRVWGGTFHHIANRILRRHGRRVGVEPDFTILDREDAGELLGSCLAQTKIKITKRRFPQKRVLASISSSVQNTLCPLGIVLARHYAMFTREESDIARVLDLYARTKRERQLLDYDDLLSQWLRLVQEHEDVRELLAGQFLHILVDEYQDTNPIQGKLVDLLAATHRNVCVVGDDAQSIYSFRGADLRNIIGFRTRYPDCREYRLETNYRSTPEILALANANAARNRTRLPKELVAARPSGLKPAVVTCHDHFVQCRFIAEYILHLLDQGAQLEDIAVLYRSHWHSPEIQLELQRRNIPHQVRGGVRFFEQAHIKDVLAFMRILHNPRDDLAWLRVLKLLPRVGTRLSQRIWAHISASGQPLDAVAEPATANLLPAPARPFFQGFAAMLGALRDLDAPAGRIERILDDFYDDYRVSHFDNAHLRKEDIKGMMHFASQYKTSEGFLADVALAGEFSGETVVEGPQEDKFVTLSTVHQAKGLEWPVVLIPWLADGRFPTDFAINTEADEEEERRVFHVAVTRARDELYLVVPQIFSRGGKGPVMMKPSRFIRELDPGLVEPMEVEEGLPDLTVGE
jgi:DNA helicase-2/ATP-dependent DNA helicase PcrA